MTITLRQENGLWVANHSGAGAREISELMGTNDIPTAFTSEADKWDVAARIQELNPEAKVVLA